MTDEIAGRRVLVTGGAGVIGRELLGLLGSRGATILSVDRLPLPGPAPENVRHLTADLATADLDDVTAFEPEVVFHLAATFERSAESAEFWEQNWSDNVVVTHRLAEALARPRKTACFVFASSYLIYRTSEYLFATPPTTPAELSEASEITPRNLCGSAKLYGEAELVFARDVMGGSFRTVSARIFRVFGLGSRDVVSRWARAAILGEPIELYHPENRFDYIFSRDVAEGLLRMAIEPRADGVINLGSGRARPVSDVVAAIEDAVGHQFEIRTRSIDEPFEASQANISRLRDLLGWAPSIDLEAGVREVVAHEREALLGAS
jgi:nucleoside-diphosphate-sugar epimerase